MIRSLVITAAASTALLSSCAQDSEPAQAAEAEAPAETVEVVEAPTSEASVIGPEIGSAAPAITAVRADGTATDLAGISGSNGAVLVFSRSLDWCPFCKTQANDLNNIATQLADAGYPLSLVTYDSTDILSAYAQTEGLSYTLLSDADSAVIDGFNLRNADVPADSRFDGIPHPAVIFVGTDGTVQATLREEGYRTRPSNDVILAQVASLSTSE
ncbi:MAG: peroxiredoxin family protein [Pseudomonadota bacterium]